MKRIGIGALVLLALLVMGGLFRGVKPASAQDEQQTGNFRIYPDYEDAKIKDVPVMLTALRDGVVVGQGEKTMDRGTVKIFDKLPSGAYDVRAEGDGLVTQVKRGVHIIAGKPTELTFMMKPGAGTSGVEYAPGAFTRDEIANRLAKLEAAVEALKKK